MSTLQSKSRCRHDIPMFHKSAVNCRHATNVTLMVSRTMDALRNTCRNPQIVQMSKDRLRDVHILPTFY